MRNLSPTSLFVLHLFLLTGVFQSDGAESSTERRHVSFPDPRLAVHGLPWFDEDKPVLRRLPLRF